MRKFIRIKEINFPEEYPGLTEGYVYEYDAAGGEVTLISLGGGWRASYDELDFALDVGYTDVSDPKIPPLTADQRAAAWLAAAAGGSAPEAADAVATAFAQRWKSGEFHA